MSTSKRAGRPKSSKWFCIRFLDPEALAATAIVLDVRVVEAEAFVQSLAGEIEFGAVDVGQAFRVDEDLHAKRLEDGVLGRRFVDVLQLVGQAGAAGGAHAETQP